MVEIASDAVTRVINHAARAMSEKTASLRDADAPTNTQLSYALEKFRTRYYSLGMSKDAIEAEVDRARVAVRRCYQVCESPIERLVIPWLVLIDYGKHFIRPPFVHLINEDTTLPSDRDLFLIPQFAFSRYRMDFALYAHHNGRTKIIAIECDGAKYHNADNDRLRDAYLRGFGIETFRATGSELHAAPHVLATNVASSIWGWAENVRIS